MEELIPVEYSNQRILLTSQLAESYETTERRISENFTRNQDHYIEGKHFYCLEGDEKRDFVDRTQIADSLKNASGLYLWTEKGALLHAKSLGTDKAWEVYDMLVETYFEAKKIKPMSQVEMLAAQAQAMVELERKANEAKQIATDTKAAVTTALDVFTKPVGDDWQQCMNERVRKICAENQLSYLQFFGDLYREVDRTAHVDLKSRQSRKKTRLKTQGAKITEIKAVSELSIIDGDPQLRLILDSIVRRYEAKYAALHFPEGAA
jgi:hypothetical protein